jgi:hypothetical protein
MKEQEHRRKNVHWRNLQNSLKLCVDLKKKRIWIRIRRNRIWILQRVKDPTGSEALSMGKAVLHIIGLFSLLQGLRTHFAHFLALLG